MGAPVVVLDRVSKKYRRGERHDSLRDLIPHAFGRLFRRRSARDLADNEFWAVRDVSFSVAQGEGFGIVGANGAGKSTTLKLLTRILKPTSGCCSVRGRVGALIEVAAGFHPDLTGRENIFLQGAIMGMRQAEVSRRFDEIVEFAGVGQFIDTPVKRYSSGMNARLGFAIAAHLEPDVLFIDEVLSVGDMAFQSRCVERMLAVKKRGVTLVFVSHNLAAVQTICERSLMLQGGRCAAIGPTRSVLEQYVLGLQAAHAPAGAGQGHSLTVLDARSDTGANLAALAPGAPLRVQLRAHTPRRITSLVLVTQVVEVATQALAANLNTLLPVSPPTETFDIDVQLDLNLLRGLYSLSFSLFDTEAQEHLVWLRPALTFGIDEQGSYSGVAYLNLRVSVPEAQQPLPAVAAAGASSHVACS